MVHAPWLPRWCFQIVFTFTSSHSYFRKIPRFDNYFQIGWNHHLALHLFSLRFNAAPTTSHAKCIHTHRQDLMMAGVAARRAFFIHSGGKAGNAIFVGQQLIWRRTFGHPGLYLYLYIYIYSVHIFTWVRIVSAHLLDILKKATNRQFTIDLDLSGTCNAFSFNSGSVFFWIEGWSWVKDYPLKSVHFFE